MLAVCKEQTEIQVNVLWKTHMTAMVTIHLYGEEQLWLSAKYLLVCSKEEEKKKVLLKVLI